MVEINVLLETHNSIFSWLNKVSARAKNDPLIGFLFGDSSFLIKEKTETTTRLRITLEPFIPKVFITYFVLLGVVLNVGLGFFVAKFFFVIAIIGLVCSLLIWFFRSRYFYQSMIKKGLRRNGYPGKFKFFGGVKR